jgi:hypothetical protein
MTDLNTTNEAAVRAWCDANGMVLVSRPFWVAAANAIRKASGHAIANEPELSDAEAWNYVRSRVTAEIADQLESLAGQDPECVERLRTAATAVRVGIPMTPGHVESG